jgi:hypothetical protein
MMKVPEKTPIYVRFFHVCNIIKLMMLMIFLTIIKFLL